MRKDKLTLVAGGAGFIGSNLCKALMESGERVICLDNLQTARPANLAMLETHEQFEFVRGDIVDPLPQAILDRAGEIARIYHLACPASPPQYQLDPEHTMLTNVVGTDNLLRFAEQSDARLLLTSTSEVYGDPECHPQQEGYRGNVSCTGPRACYDEGKRAAETLAFDFARAGRTDVRVARIFNTYGPHMHPEDGRVVSNFICSALTGNPITIYGDGSQTRSFCYVSDMVEALRRLMESDLSTLEPVNLGNPQEIAVADLVSYITDLISTNSRICYEPLPQDDPTRRRPNIGRANSLLGWHPATPLEEGLKASIEWFAREVAADRMIEYGDAPLSQPLVQSA